MKKNLLSLVCISALAVSANAGEFGVEIGGIKNKLSTDFAYGNKKYKNCNIKR
jgi:hypothetical protein